MATYNPVGLNVNGRSSEAMKFWTHRDYFRTYQLSAAQYGEILVAQVFRGKKLGDSQRCYDVEAQSDALKHVLAATGADEGSPLWPRTSDVLRIEVRSKLSQTPAGKATVVHCKDSNLNGTASTPGGMTHLAVVIVHPGSGGGGGAADPGRVVNAWLLTREAARQLRQKDGRVQYIRVSQLAGGPAPDGVVSITSLVAAAAEMPLEFLDADNSAESPAIRKTAGVCGGSACVGDSRIPVWTLWRMRELGLTDSQLLEAYPSLTQQGLSAAWEYAVRNAREITEEVSRQTSGNGHKERATA
jgi:uncharacterized protein (DUF433 family)